MGDDQHCHGDSIGENGHGDNHVRTKLRGNLQPVNVNLWNLQKWKRGCHLRDKFVRCYDLKSV